MTELQQLMEDVKMLKDSVQQETEEKNKLQAAITDKDVCLERALADTDHLKTQLAEKEEQVGSGLQVGHRTGKQLEGRAASVEFGLQWDLQYNFLLLIKKSYITKQKTTATPKHYCNCSKTEANKKSISQVYLHI